MTAASFAAAVAPDAQIASSRTGVPVSVILAQWIDETGAGTSPAWVSGNNYAGVSAGGSVNGFPDRAAGLAAYISTMMQGYYAAVRSAGTPTAAAAALGASPWAAGHYDAGGGPPGSDLQNIITANHLTAYDTATPSASSAGSTATAGTLAAGSGSGTTATNVVDLNPSHIPAEVVSTLLSTVRRPLLEGVILIAAVAMVGLGAYRTAAPALKPAIDKAKATTVQAAQVAAMA